jgi:hypothetical protein
VHPAGSHSTDKTTTSIIIIIIIIIFSGSAAQRGLWPPRPRGFLTTHNDVPQSVGLLWTSDQLVADNTQHIQQTPMPPVRFEPTIAAVERP